MGACASQLPTAVVVGEKLSESSVNSLETVNPNNKIIVGILDKLIEGYSVMRNGSTKSYLCLYALVTQLKNHFGSEYVTSMVDVAAIRQHFEASGWTYVPPESNEYFTMTFVKATKWADS